MSKRKEASWDEIFGKVKLSRVPFPSKLSVELYGRVEKYLPKRGKILEVGSGSGEMSAYFARMGHEVYLIDKEDAALDLSRRLFKKYSLEGEMVKGDMFDLPYEDGYFDAVWNSGVLEHFDDGVITEALTEMARVSRDVVFSLVPSAGGVVYRMAKHMMELEGRWPYGDEFPKETMEPMYRGAGLDVVEEGVIDRYGGMMWLGQVTKVKRDTIDELAAWAQKTERGSLDEGLCYLLLTVGSKKKRGKKLNERRRLLGELARADIELKELRRKVRIYEESKFWRVYRGLRRMKGELLGR